MRLKAVKGCVAPAISLIARSKGDVDYSYCPVHRSAAYQMLCKKLGKAGSSYLFSLSGGSDALSSTAINERLQAHLAAGSLFAGESAHGIWRGRLQHDHANGPSLLQLSALGQIQTPDVLQRYLDPFKRCQGCSFAEFF